MFGINGVAAQALYERAPSTFKAMQHLVMAMDDVAKWTGKKTWFGRDKTEQMIAVLAQRIGETISAMRDDGTIEEGNSAEDVRLKLHEQLSQFFEAFPSWMQAQIFSTIFFSQNDSLEIIRIKIAELGKSKNTTIFDKPESAAREIIIAGYREIARQIGRAPTSKTSDDEIIAIYRLVGTAFHEVAETRGERLSSGIKNSIVLYFLQIKEDNPSTDFFAEHLKYELDRYRTNGLRDGYRRELDLLQVLGLNDS